MASLVENFIAPLDTLGGSIWPHVALPATQILALTLPPFRGRAAIFVTLLLSIVYLTWNNLFTANAVGRAAMVGQWPWYMGTIGRLLFTNPENDFWRVEQKPQEALDMTFSQKLRWSAALYCSPRGIGWNFEVKGVPKAPKRTRSEFLWFSLKWLAAVWLYMDVSGVYVMERFYKGAPDPAKMPFISMDRQWTGQILFDVTLATLTMIYCPVQYLYTIMALISVALGSNPDHWPPIFGNNLLEITTVRAIWNTFWHQIIRQTFTTWSRGVANLLGIKRGTWLSAYFQLHFVYLFTACGHGITTYAASYQTREAATFQTRFMPFFTFYILQGVGTHFEDFVWWCYKSLVTDPETDSRLARFRKVVGWIWVISFWTWFADPGILVCLQSGVAAESPLPFSVVTIVLKRMGWLFS